MQIQETGTAGAIRTKLQAEGKSENAVDSAVLTTIDQVLGSVADDRQATVNASSQRTTDLTRVYVDITLVPSAAVQEAKAIAGRAPAAESTEAASVAE